MTIHKNHFTDSVSYSSNERSSFRITGIIKKLSIKCLSELQIRRGNRENLEIISRISQNIFCEPSLELSENVIMFSI